MNAEATFRRISESLYIQDCHSFLGFRTCNCSVYSGAHSVAPSFYKIVVTHQAEKIWMYDHTTIRPYKVLLLTCMVNCTAGTPMPQPCPVVSALGSESDDLGSSPGRVKALCP